MSTTATPVILLVDDVPENLAVLSALLRPQYRVLAATDGEEALRLASGDMRPDLILLDVMMPVMNGYTLLARLRDQEATRDIPVLFLTALADAEDEEYGLQLGANDYLTKPIKPAVVLARVRTQLEAKRARDGLKGQNALLEAEVARRMEENNLIQLVAIRALAHLAEIRDPETGNHILRTQGYVSHLATRLQQHPRFRSVLNDHFIDLLTRSAALHDIGKVGIPDHILLKPGKLDADEWAVMQSHTRLGAEAIERAQQDIGRPLEFLSLAREIALWHHERWDGSGYPDGLKGDAIPVSARIMALADVFDALVSVRPYKRALPFAEARDIIAAGRGSHFDPDVADAFLNDFHAFCSIARKYGEPADVLSTLESPLPA